MVASFFSSVSRGAIDFEYNINLNRQHIVHAGLFRLNIYQLNSRKKKLEFVNVLTKDVDVAQAYS